MWKFLALAFALGACAPKALGFDGSVGANPNLGPPASVTAERESSGTTERRRTQFSLGAFAPSSGSSGFGVKADYSYFVPKWHEAAVSLWYLDFKSDDGIGGRASRNVIAGTTEYRWRFGGHGLAYYGMGLGFHGGTSSGGVFTDGLGVEFKNVSLEIRGFVGGASEDSGFLFALGGRF